MNFFNSEMPEKFMVEKSSVEIPGLKVGVEMSFNPNEGSSIGSVGGRSTRSGRRDSLSPDSANEESKSNT